MVRRRGLSTRRGSPALIPVEARYKSFRVYLLGFMAPEKLSAAGSTRASRSWSGTNRLGTLKRRRREEARGR